MCPAKQNIRFQLSEAHELNTLCTTQMMRCKGARKGRAIIIPFSTTITTTAILEQL